MTKTLTDMGGLWGAWLPACTGTAEVSRLTALARKLGLVGVRGFEPPAPASRTQCSTRLSYTPAKAAHIALCAGPGKASLQSRGLDARRTVQAGQTLQHRRDAIQHLKKLPHLGQGKIGLDRRL